MKIGIADFLYGSQEGVDFHYKHLKIKHTDCIIMKKEGTMSHGFQYNGNKLSYFEAAVFLRRQISPHGSQCILLKP